MLFDILHDYSSFGRPLGSHDVRETLWGLMVDASYHETSGVSLFSYISRLICYLITLFLTTITFPYNLPQRSRLIQVKDVRLKGYGGYSYSSLGFHTYSPSAAASTCIIVKTHSAGL